MFSAALSPLFPGEFGGFTANGGAYALIRVTQHQPVGRKKLRDEKIIATFRLWDDLLKAIEHHESAFPQRLDDAEVITIARGAASCFQGRHDPARFMLAQHGYIPGTISKSPFNRRLHRLKDAVATVFDFLGQLWKTLDAQGVYVIDSFPVAVCDNIRTRRAKLHRHEACRGHQAGKRRCV